MTQPYYDPKTGNFTLHIDGPGSPIVRVANQDDLDEILDHAENLQRVRDRKAIKTTKQAHRLGFSRFVRFGREDEN
jgi:hypothetical protein